MGKTVGDALRVAEAWTARADALEAIEAAPDYRRWRYFRGKREEAEESDPTLYAFRSVPHDVRRARKHAERCVAEAERRRQGNRERIARYRAAHRGENAS